MCRAVFVTALLFLISLNQYLCTLQTCSKQGDRYVCSGVFTHTGSLSGDIVTPSDFSLAGATYSPINPLSFTLTRSTTHYGVVRCVVTYHEPIFITGPDCGNESLSDNLHWVNPALDLNFHTVLTDAAVTKITATEGFNTLTGDYAMACANTSVKNLFPHICPAHASITLSRFSYQGFIPGQAGLVCSIDHSFQMQNVVVKSTIDGVSATATHDISNPILTNGLIVKYISGAGSHDYDFLWKRSSDGKYYIPNSNYTGIDNATLFNHWASPITGPGMYLSVGEDICDDYATVRHDFCLDDRNKALSHICGAYPSTVTLLTKEMKSEMPSTLSVATVGDKLMLTSSANIDETTVDISYTASFKLDAPALKFKGYEWACGDETGMILYENAGNAGESIVTFTLVSGITSDVPYTFGVGSKAIQFVGKTIKQACIGSECISLACLESVKPASTSSWTANLFPFKSSPGLATFQLITTVVVGILLIVGLVKLGRAVRRNGIRFWRTQGRVNPYNKTKV